ncbi:MAG: glycerophosphodiester phosphodiesterase [Gammaproteobacteria bacterium]|nr:glycerophosphodiester phosphodiesterase [Gammaproteobacteria bacterium]
MRYCGVSLCCVLLAACGAAPSSVQKSSAMPDSPVVPIVIAHRGASGYAPEHTSESKALAHAMGADFIEQDVVLTRDGVPIVLHDVELDTTTDVALKFPDRHRPDGRYYAIDFSIAEIAQLNVHERTDARSGKQLYPGRFSPPGVRFGVRVLDEEIALIAGLNGTTRRATGLYTEIKAPAWHRAQGKDVTRTVMNSLTAAGLRLRTDPVWVQCFDPAELQRIRNELNSDLKLVQLIGENDWGDARVDFEQMRTPQGLAQVAQYADGIGVWIPHVVRWQNGKRQFTSLVRDAHALRLKVHVYTLRRDSLPEGASDFPAVHAALLEAGVDGVFSDFPDESRTLLRK